MTCSRATSPAEEENDDSQQTKLVMDAGHLGIRPV
jgi:hypothetical protein